MDRETESLGAKPSPDPKANFDDAEISSFGRFTDLQLVGKGGMGVVYKAHDPLLGRAVALKFIRGQDPELARRLLFEARAQAQIDHPNVCKVYEAGELEPRQGAKVGFIAMQYINGRSLSETAQQLSSEQKVEIVRQVAEALHAAHRVGVIHRDVKPANILLERQETGAWVPYITDFGLARENTGPALTSTGMIVGSPWYMSPEQATGDRNAVDRRSDVYSLGTTLYELLSGKLPFPGGSSVTVLMQLVSEDPTPLRAQNESIPRDLETIVMKCLEKEPGRRYESAKALADDLRRYLDGEIIQARPSTFSYRMSKRIRRHRAVVVTACIAFALVLTFAFIGYNASRTAEKQAAIAQEFGGQIKEIEAIMRYSYMMPRHDVSREKAIVQRKMRAIHERMKLLGRLAEGPGNYALGQGHIALGEYAEARGHLQTAWDDGYRLPEVAYALGQALAELYQNGLDRVSRLPDAQERKARSARMQDEFRKPALDCLKKADAGSMDRQSAAYAEGLLALMDEDYETALKKAHEAAAEVPWLFEAWKLEADADRGKATKLADSGDFRNAIALLEKAGQAYSTAIGIAASNPDLYEGQCRVRVSSDLMKVQMAPYTREDFERTIAACDLALAANPRSADALVSKARAYGNYGQNSYEHGHDPREFYKRGIEFGMQALSIDPNQADACRSIAETYWMFAGYQIANGENPGEAVNRSLEILKRGVRIQPNDPSLYNNIGNSYLQMTQFEVSQGRDPERWARPAIESYEKAMSLSRLWVAYSNLALACQYRACYAAQHGKDPLPDYNRAVNALQTGLADNPDHPLIQNNLGFVLREKAGFEQEQGIDPRKDIEASVAALRKAIQLDPAGALAYGNLAIVYNIEAAWEAANGVDPTANLQLARSAVRKTLELNHYLYGHPDYPRACATDLIAARWAMRNGADPTAMLERMRASLAPSIRLNPRNPTVYLSLAESYLLEADWQVRRGRSGKTELSSAVEAARQALAINGEMPEALALQGKLLLRGSEWGYLVGPESGQAAELLHKALLLNPHLRHQYGDVLEQASRKLAMR